MLNTALKKSRCIYCCYLFSGSTPGFEATTMTTSVGTEEYNFS